jgi:hypothetical protein
VRADLSGTGLVVTQVCPAPVDKGFDKAAGSVGGMTRPRHCPRTTAQYPGQPLPSNARFGLPLGQEGCGLLHHELADVAVNFRPLRSDLQGPPLAIVACP